MCHNVTLTFSSVSFHFQIRMVAEQNDSRGYGRMRHSPKGLVHIHSVQQAIEKYSSSPTIRNSVSRWQPIFVIVLFTGCQTASIILFSVSNLSIVLLTDGLIDWLLFTTTVFISSKWDSVPYNGEDPFFDCFEQKKENLMSYYHILYFVILHPHHLTN